MYRSEQDIALLTELLGVLDQTVAANGLTSGTYLVLRALHGADTSEPSPVTVIAEQLEADGTEVAEMLRRLAQDGLADVRPNGVRITGDGIARLSRTEDEANAAIREHVLDRPHTATVYGLVAAMQAGRFTVDDLLEFVAEGAGPGDDEAAAD